MFFGKREAITVSLIVHGPATRLMKPGDYALRSGDKVKALLKAAGLSGSVPGLSVLIDGERVEQSHKLSGGEAVTVLQMIAGG